MYYTYVCRTSATLAECARSVSIQFIIYTLMDPFQVRCDRDDPCGNCVDGNISCSRTPSSLRESQLSSKRRRTTDCTARSKKSARRPEFDVSPSPSTYSPTVSESPSVIEAQDFIRRQIGAAHYMSAERLGVLNSAMSFVNHLLRATKPDSCNTNARVSDVMDGITYPTVELLYWMLRGSVPLFHFSSLA